MANSLADETVLFVDDEESILNALKRELINEEYHCLFALSGNQALDIMNHQNISVIVSDIRMPDMDGIGLLKVVKEKYPAAARVALSGYAQLPQTLVAINQAEVFKFLTKPWGSELKTVIYEAIAYHQLLQDREKISRLIRSEYDGSPGIYPKIENAIMSARYSNQLFAALGVKAFEVAIEALDSPEKHVMAKQQLRMAASLLRTLSNMEFEEYANTPVKAFYENLSQMLLKGNVTKVEIDTEANTKTIRTRQKALSAFIAEITENLTDYPHDYVIKIKSKTIESGHSLKHEMLLSISKKENLKVMDKEHEYQVAYVDMLNTFAQILLSHLSGEFLALVADNSIKIKIVVHDNGQQW